MFRKKINTAQTEISSLIGIGTQIMGDINFSGGLRIDGRVRGNITAMGDKFSSLALSDNASIEGEIYVSHAVINGTVIGPVHAVECLELQAKARVSGDVYYRALEIQLGAAIEGVLVHQDHQDRINKSDQEKVPELAPTSDN